MKENSDCPVLLVLMPRSHSLRSSSRGFLLTTEIGALTAINNCAGLLNSGNGNAVGALSAHLVGCGLGGLRLRSSPVRAWRRRASRRSSRRKSSGREKSEFSTRTPSMTATGWVWSMSSARLAFREGARSSSITCFPILTGEQARFHTGNRATVAPSPTQSRSFVSSAARTEARDRSLARGELFARLVVAAVADVEVISCSACDCFRIRLRLG